MHVEWRNQYLCSTRLELLDLFIFLFWLVSPLLVERKKKMVQIGTQKGTYWIFFSQSQC